MIVGLNKFREYFGGFENHYAIIGGAACDLLFDKAGLPFRSTKDIDMVLCVEVVDRAFGERFKAFVDAGGYKARERSDGKKEFYRFREPADPDFPYMIELFARKPGALALPDEATLAPIAVDDDIVSLSAILLDDGYYEAMQAAKREIDGVTVLDETLLIPFKAHACLDLLDRSQRGEKIDSKNIRKHRNDVFRLVQLLQEGAVVSISDPIRADLRRFIDLVKDDTSIDPKQFDVRISRQDAVALIRSAYSIP